MSWRSPSASISTMAMQVRLLISASCRRVPPNHHRHHRLGQTDYPADRFRLHRHHREAVVLDDFLDRQNTDGKHPAAGHEGQILRPLLDGSCPLSGPRNERKLVARWYHCVHLHTPQNLANCASPGEPPPASAGLPTIFSRPCFRVPPSPLRPACAPQTSGTVVQGPRWRLFAYSEVRQGEHARSLNCATVLKSANPTGAAWLALVRPRYRRSRLGGLQLTSSEQTCPHYLLP